MSMSMPAYPGFAIDEFHQIFFNFQFQPFVPLDDCRLKCQGANLILPYFLVIGFIAFYCK